MQWYHPKSISVPHWFQRFAAFDCVADPDRQGLALYAVDYMNAPSKRRPIYVRRSEENAIVMPDRILQKKISGMPVRFHYPIELDRADALHIPIGGLVRRLDVNAIPDRPATIGLAMSTMFLHDCWVLPLWLDHYRRLGVDWFFLYYNGRRDDLEAALKALGGLDVSDCTFVEWNFSKFQQHKFVFEKGRIKSAHNDRHTKPNMHHAQRAEMLHAATAFAGEWKIPWMGYFDLDEFLVLDRWADLPECIAANGDPDGLIFENRWAEDRGDPPPYGDRMKRQFADVYANPNCAGPDRRTKFFVRPEAMIMPGVHRPIHRAKGATLRAVPPDQAHFLHFHNFTKSRTDWFGTRRNWVPCKI